jgi:hypothetical protein
MIRRRTQIILVAVSALLLVLGAGYLFDALDKLEQLRR